MAPPRRVWMLMVPGGSRGGQTSGGAAPADPVPAPPTRRSGPSGDLDRLDHHVLGGAVHGARPGGGDGIHDLARVLVRDLAEDGVAVVQVRGGADGDEGLRTVGARAGVGHGQQDRKSTRLNSSHVAISYAVFCLKQKTKRFAR